MEKFTKTERKSILIYSIELLVFAVVFVILGSLRITGVIGYSEQRRIVFNWITIIGGGIGIGDFIWYLFSKRRRARNFLPDKLAVLALAIFMITYDIICFTTNPTPEFCTYMLGGALIYVGAIYLFQGIYHYFYPLPGYLDDIRKAIAEDEANEAKKKAEEEAKKAEEEKQNNEEEKKDAE